MQDKEMSKIYKFGQVLGIIAGIVSIVLWFILVFANPYAPPGNGTIITTFVMLFLPACLATYSSLKSKQALLLIAFIWSFPISLYVYFTPGIFFFFGITSLLYLFSYVIIFVSQKITEMKKIRQNSISISNTGKK